MFSGHKSSDTNIPEPYIESVSPNYGPQAGGTNITVTGHLLKQSPEDQLSIILKSEGGHNITCKPSYWLVYSLEMVKLVRLVIFIIMNRI